MLSAQLDLFSCNIIAWKPKREISCSSDDLQPASSQRAIAPVSSLVPPRPGPGGERVGRPPRAPDSKGPHPRYMRIRLRFSKCSNQNSNQSFLPQAHAPPRPGIPTIASSNSDLPASGFPLFRSSFAPDRAATAKAARLTADSRQHADATANRRRAAGCPTVTGSQDQGRCLPGR